MGGLPSLRCAVLKCMLDAGIWIGPNNNLLSIQIPTRPTRKTDIGRRAMAVNSNKRRVILKTAAAVPVVASFGRIVSTDVRAATKGANTAAQPVIDPLLRRAAESGDVAGVVAMAATNGGVLYQGAFGKRDLVKGTDMTLDSVFWIASMTKAITATAAM